MRTVTTKTTTSPIVYLAIESQYTSQEVEAHLSRLGCHCRSASTPAKFGHLLESETPALVVVSLELGGQCALQFSQDHPLLLDKIPVVFLASDPEISFSKSLSAIRLGAVDVLVLPLNHEKLAELAELAKQNSSSRRMPIKADFFVNDGAIVGQSAAAQLLKIAANGQEYSFEKASRLQAPLKIPASSPFATPASPSKNGPDRLALPDNGFVDSCPRSHKRQANYAVQVKELESWILGSSPAMQAVRSIIAEVAETKANVMIYGASGTGKELVATAVHKLSNRSKGPFEPVNMTEIPHDLAESLLFGHEKGAFTGADSRQVGVCEAAHGGTLFLDEIGEMAIETQPKLLRFLQEGTVKRIGSRTFKKVDVRVITATNRTPETIVKDGLMREDLFFRLHVVPIHIPPLRERPEDIEELAMLFLRRYMKAYDRSIEGFTEEALDIFRRHNWPGNVRQLENVVERLVVFAKSRFIGMLDIPSEIHAASMFDSITNSTYGHHQSNAFDKKNSYVTNGHDSETATAIASMSTIQRTERSAIVEALQRADGHVIDAANLLGLGQATVYRKIKQYHIPHQRRRRRRTPK